MHRGQSTDFAAEVVTDSQLDAVTRRVVFTPLIPGVHYDVQVRYGYTLNLVAVGMI